MYEKKGSGDANPQKEKKYSEIIIANFFLLNVYYRPGIMLNSLHALSHLFLTATILDIILQRNWGLEIFTQG